MLYRLVEHNFRKPESLSGRANFPCRRESLVSDTYWDSARRRINGAGGATLGSIKLYA